MSMGNTTAWHALRTDEVVQQLATHVDTGLDAGEATSRLQKYGPNRLPEGKQRRRSCASLRSSTTCSSTCCSAPASLKLMLGLWLDAGDHPRRGASQRAARLHPGGQGGEGAGLDPQHAVGRGAHPARRRDAHDRRPRSWCRATSSCSNRATRCRRTCAWSTSKNLRTEEAALTGESVPADKTVDPVRREVHGRRPREHGLLRHDGGVGPRHRGRGRHRQRDRARPHQPVARRRQRARDAAAAPDQEVRLPDHGRHRPSSASLVFAYGRWVSGNGLRRAVPGRGRHRGVGDSRKACRRSSRSRWPSACSAWRSATRSSAGCRPSRRWARCRASARTRPAP